MGKVQTSEVPRYISSHLRHPLGFYSSTARHIAMATLWLYPEAPLIGKDLPQTSPGSVRVCDLICVCV